MPRRERIKFALEESDLKYLQQFLKGLWHINGFEGGAASIDSRSAAGEMPIHYAVKYKDDRALKALLESGANPNAVGEDEYTPLHWAVVKEAEDCVKLLMAFGADVNIVNAFGDSPKDLARRSKSDVVSKLVS